MNWVPAHALLLLVMTIISFYGAIYIEQRREKYPRLMTGFFIVVLLLPLVTYKYFSFFVDTISSLFSIEALFGSGTMMRWIVPIGISFYTFQAIGYLVEVYRGQIKAECSFLNYALFLSFFPQTVSGPISKGVDLLPQIQHRNNFDMDLFCQGIKFFLWGMFLKMVLADRIGMYVDLVYNNLPAANGKACLFAIVLYSFQIYGDFSGYSLMAVGVAATFGIRLINNFNHPYIAISIRDFWKRWHISFTRWLTSNVYISLGGNRCSRLRQYCNIMATFLVSGLWHGASWNFLIWGAIHGVLQIIEKIVGIQSNLSCSTSMKRLYKIVRMLMTFVVVSIAWVFFRLTNFSDAFIVFHKVFFEFKGDIPLLSGQYTMKYIAFALFVVVLRTLYDVRIKRLYPSIRRYGLAWYISLVFMILLIGVLDSGQFIYGGF
mgnify:CR=1 FL=1